MSDEAARRDLNGRPVIEGRLRRLRQRMSGERPGPALDVSDPALVVVAESSDESAASSSVLAGSAWVPENEVVLCHLLRLPSSRVDDAVATAALDGYRRVAGADHRSDALETVVLARVQLLDAVHLSQERSRMASLGSRHGGTVIGWEVRQRPVV